MNKSEYIVRSQMENLLGTDIANSVYGICHRVLTDKKTMRTYTRYLKHGEPTERMADANAYKIAHVIKLLMKRTTSPKAPLWFDSRHEIIRKLKGFRDGTIKIDNPTLISRGD